MSVIIFKGNEYPTRTFVVISPEFKDERQYTISTERLYNSLGEKRETWGSEENDIDNKIYYYVEDEVINLEASEICKNHLDIPMELIEEIFD
jgi:hypothetical protein